MGQQTNKIEKRRRRLNYLARRKEKSLAVAVSKPIVKKKPAAPKKKAEATTPAPVVE